MRLMMNSRWTVIVTLGLSAAGSALHASAQTAPPATCADLYQMIERALPAAVGDPVALQALLDAGAPSKVTPVRFDACRALAGLGETCSSFQRTCKNTCDNGASQPADDCTYDGTAGAVLRVRGPKGRYKYLNASRGFDPNRDPDNAVSDAEARSRARSAAGEFGIPLGELLEETSRVVTIQLFGSDPEGRESLRRPAERLVVYGRQIGGTPVFGSRLKAAINPRSTLSRLHLSWPSFALAPGLDANRAQRRADVAQQLFDKFKSEGGCSAIEAVDAFLVYAPIGSMDAGDGGDDGSDEGGASPGVESYAPALAVRVTGHDAPSGPGGYSNAVEIFAIPLLNEAHDSDETVRSPTPGGSLPRPNASQLDKLTR